MVEREEVDSDLNYRCPLLSPSSTIPPLTLSARDFPPPSSSVFPHSYAPTISQSSLILLLLSVPIPLLLLPILLTLDLFSADLQV